MPEIEQRRQPPKTEIRPPALEDETIHEADELGMEEDPGEFAVERIEEIEDLTDQLVEEGEAGVEKISKEIGLPPEKTDEVKGGLGLLGRMKDIWGKLRGRNADTVGKIRNLASVETASMEENETPPLAPGEIFDPAEELKKIRGLHGKDGREAMQKFKEKMVYQRVGLAEMQEGIVDMIRKKPDTSLESFNQTVAEFAQKYGFTEEQKKSAEAIFKTYQEKHNLVSKMKHDFPKDRDLFRVMFGRDPKGKLKVVEGPMTLYFQCANLEDYAMIVNQTFLEGREPTPAELVATNASGGGSIGSSLITGLEGTIIAQNATRKDANKFSETVLQHEEQHQIKRLFGDKTAGPATSFKEVLSAADGPEKEQVLHRFLESKRQERDENFKDEILAYFKQDEPLEQILGRLTQSRETGGIYDYFADAKGAAQQLIPMVGEKYRTVIEKLTDDIFVKEHRQFVQDGVEAFATLKKNGFSTEETIAVLLQEPLARWRRTAKLLTETKGGKSVNE